ncbi:TPA: hypothetical protein RJE17_001831 [Staphylococcus aureus]|nr:hypothetical protein [Staphylococcus aureus]
MKVGPWNGSSKNATNSIKPFQKGNIVKVGPWNGSSKNATNSIKPFQKAGVKKTVKILKKR